MIPRLSRFRSFTRLPFIATAILLLPALAAPLHAGPIFLISADLRADLSFNASTVGGGPTSHAADADTGNLTNPSVSTDTAARLPLKGIDTVVTQGHATADLTPFSGNSFAAGLRFDGAAFVTVGVNKTPFTGDGSSTSITTVTFGLASSGAFDVTYDAFIGSTQPSAGTRLNIDLFDLSKNSLLSIPLTPDFTGFRETGTRQVTLAPGQYAFTVDALALANHTPGINPGDSGDIDFHITLAPRDAATAIPLPPAALPGLMILTLAAWATRNFTHPARV
jgi:hypothetical protein